jgi:hypothetical protein
MAAKVRESHKAKAELLAQGVVRVASPAMRVERRFLSVRASP